MATVHAIRTLPVDHLSETGRVGIVITNGVTTYFSVTGEQLDQVASIKWHPMDVSTVDFDSRPMALIDQFMGTFSIRIINNHLNISDRGGWIVVKLMDGSRYKWPVMTYGPPASGPLWQSPQCGLKTG